MTRITTYLSILQLNVNRLNSPIKGRFGKWIKKEDPTICCLQETRLIERNKHLLRMKVWKKIYQDCGLPKQTGVPTLVSDKVDFKLTLIKEIKKETPPQ
jgi:exonuclease III